MNYSIIFLLIITYSHFIFAGNENKYIKVKGIKRSKNMADDLNSTINTKKVIRNKNTYVNFVAQSRRKIERNENNYYHLTKRDDDTNNDGKETMCDITEFGECAIAINIRDAKSQCSDDAKCPENLMKKYNTCFSELYNTSDDIPILDQPYYTSINEIGLPFSFICKKSGDEWCYDSYKLALQNQTLLHEFICSDCGSIAYSQYNLLIEKNETLSDTHNEQVQQFIKEYNLCHNTSMSMKIIVNIPMMIIINILINSINIF